MCKCTCKPSPLPCLYYSLGSCKFDDRCYFSHDGTPLVEQVCLLNSEVASLRQILSSLPPSNILHPTHQGESPSLLPVTQLSPSDLDVFDPISGINNAGLKDGKDCERPKPRKSSRKKKNKKINQLDGLVDSLSGDLCDFLSLSSSVEATPPPSPPIGAKVSLCDDSKGDMSDPPPPHLPESDECQDGGRNESDSADSSIDTSSYSSVMCVCLVDKVKGPMLQCSLCAKWFHASCVGVEAASYIDYVSRYICPYDCLIDCATCSKVPGWSSDKGLPNPRYTTVQGYPVQYL